jgi:hypothetical protein
MYNPSMQNEKRVHERRIQFMKSLAVITDEKSDLSNVIEEIGYKTGVYTVEYINKRELGEKDLKNFDCYCILGGTSEKPFSLNASSRIVLEKEREKGKKFFVEYCLSIGDVYSAEPVKTRFSRLVYLGEDLNDTLFYEDILDDQCNDFSHTYFKGAESSPILVYKRYINSHSKASLNDDEKNDITKWALWKYDDNTLVCNFRLCNFIKARFSPMKKWQSLVLWLVSWLCDNPLNVDYAFETAYTNRSDMEIKDFDEAAKESFLMGMDWFHNANILLSGGKDGVLEGFHHDIDAKGVQKVADTVRADCAGETSGAFFVHHMLTGDVKSLEIANNLEDYCYNNMQIKEGMYKGMIRWTEVAWGVCYQDDVARVIMPTLLRSFYTKGSDRDTKHLDDVVEALWFLVKTTGTDGLRPGRTDLLYLSDEEMNRIKNNPANFPSAHYNAFYHATLLMAYKLTGIEEFKEVAVRGLTTLMTKYPDLYREQSETQEMCRLVLPLAWLYFVTGEEKHKKWLYRVCEDLKKLRHSFGSYIEWDTGYRAARSRKIDSECSLLTKNGDPVSDLLYSVNWLPLAYIQSYLITKDEMFYDMWKDITTFFIKSQILSKDSNLNGAWARGFDLEMHEVYGVPHDVGWGPWAIESGWTVAEILMGIGYGLMVDEIKQYYNE